MPSGVSLIELLVVLAILGIAAGIGGLALQHLPRSPGAGEIAAAAADARNRAVRTGRVVRASIRDSAGSHELVAHPDGRIVADSVLHIDVTTGQVKP
jgi:prepilin-type N-terminal cleavage/methylation domain-containing protein